MIQNFKKKLWIITGKKIIWFKKTNIRFPFPYYFAFFIRKNFSATAFAANLLKDRGVYTLVLNIKTKLAIINKNWYLINQFTKNDKMRNQVFWIELGSNLTYIEKRQALPVYCITEKWLISSFLLIFFSTSRYKSVKLISSDDNERIIFKNHLEHKVMCSCSRAWAYSKNA